MASFTSKVGKRGCSIVVHEGMYIDPTVCFGNEGMATLFWASNFSLEIVGIGDVRILNTCNETYLFAARGIRLSLTNLFLYDGFKRDRGTDRKSDGKPGPPKSASETPDPCTISGVDAAKISLKHVRVHGSVRTCLDVWRGSELEVDDSIFREVRYAIYVRCENLARVRAFLDSIEFFSCELVYLMFKGAFVHLSVHQLFFFSVNQKQLK